MEAEKNPEVMQEESKISSCATCGQSSKDLARCARCKKAYYCNVDCQKKHYPEHKSSCQPQQESQSTKTIPTKEENESPMDDFTDVKFVGRGNFSQIFKAVSKKDGRVYAIKQIDKSKLKRLEKEADVFMEKHCLQKLKGWEHAVQIEKTFQDELSLYIQMEFPERGELWELCRTFGIISQSLVKYYFCQIVKALNDLHNIYNIVHRDLKPENILLTKDYKIKLIDFGTAKDISRPDLKGSGNGLRRRKVFEHYVGTPNYMAPECIHNKASEKVSDVYSLAGVFYFLKTGYPPFTGGSEYLIFKKALDNLPYLPYTIFSKTEQDLILKMMEKDYTCRPSIKQLMSHTYFADVDFANLPTYEEALQKTTPEQQFLIDLKTKLLAFSDKNQCSSQERNAIYHQIEQILKEPVPSNLDAKRVADGRKLLSISSYNMLNIQEDSNMSFEEVHKKFDS